MRTGALAALAFGAVIALGGCGTMFNLNLPEEDHHLAEPTRKVYGGVMLDAKVAPGYLKGVVKGAPSATDFTRSTAALADLPLSIVGDTLTLPFVLMWQMTEPESSNKDAAEPSDQTTGK